MAFALAGTWGCQGRTQYCELLTCVVVSLTPQVSTDHIGVADAVDEEEEEDMKWRKGNNGVSIIMLQISRDNFEESFFIFGTHFSVPGQYHLLLKQMKHIERTLDCL